MSIYFRHYDYDLDLSGNGCLNPLSASPTKWSNTLKQFVRNFPTNCFSVFDHFEGLALKGFKIFIQRGFTFE